MDLHTRSSRLSPSGRVSRLSFSLRYLLVGGGLAAVGTTLLDVGATMGGANGVGSALVLAGVYLWVVGTAKRLHDLDASGWWAGVVLGVVWVGGAVAGSAVPLGLAAPILLTIIVLAPLMFLRGTGGPNRYGPDPLTTRRGR